jgi:hypothetical protein
MHEIYVVEMEYALGLLKGKTAPQRVMIERVPFLARISR